eukprot:m.107385 g.107385  ORF g.107385 m.107385 type:complete len:508 (+) comp27790_c0_seq1:123-1646(+)
MMAVGGCLGVRVLLLMHVSTCAGVVRLFASPTTTATRTGFTVELANVTKSSKNPLLREGLSPWDMAWWNTYPSLVYEPSEKKFQLFYNGFASCTGNQASTMCPSTDYPNRTHVPPTDRKIAATFYAESIDGLQWTRPSLNQVGWPNTLSSKANNIAIDGGSADPNRGILYDDHEADASKRYKAFGSFSSFDGVANRNGSKLGIVTSPDGKQWSDYVGTDSIDVSADTANNILYDEDLQLYIVFTRNWVKAGEGTYGGRREFRSTSTDYAGPWSKGIEVARGEAGYELYALLPWRQKEWPAGNYFGVGMFYADGEATQKVYCELMHSTDHGTSWVRLAPHTPFIPLGVGGSFDNHTCYAARPFVDPTNTTQTLFYYAGGNGPHSGARSDFIALATAPTNAFVGLTTPSATAPATASVATLTTAKFNLASLTPRILVATRVGARIDVSVETPIGNYTLPTSLTHSGITSAYHHVLLFNTSEAATLGVVVGARVSLHIRAQHTTLFALDI